MMKFRQDLSIFIPALRRSHALHIRRGRKKGHRHLCQCDTCIYVRGKDGEKHIDPATNRKDWAEAVGRSIEGG
jgi:hypothetical protein